MKQWAVELFNLFPYLFSSFSFSFKKERSFLLCVFEIRKRTREEKGERKERRDQKECNVNGKSIEKNRREMKTKEGGAKIRQREDGARFHLSSLSYLSLLLFSSN